MYSSPSGILSVIQDKGYKKKGNKEKEIGEVKEAGYLFWIGLYLFRKRSRDPKMFNILMEAAHPSGYSGGEGRVKNGYFNL